MARWSIRRVFIDLVTKRLCERFPRFEVTESDEANSLIFSRKVGKYTLAVIIRFLKPHTFALEYAWSDESLDMPVDHQGFARLCDIESIRYPGVFSASKCRFRHNSLLQGFCRNRNSGGELPSEIGKTEEQINQSKELVKREVEWVFWNVNNILIPFEMHLVNHKSKTEGIPRDFMK